MPTPKQVLAAALREKVADVELEPGFTDEEIEELAATLPAPLPQEIRELLRFTRGFDGPAPRILATVETTGWWSRPSYSFLLIRPDRPPVLTAS